MDKVPAESDIPILSEKRPTLPRHEMHAVVYTETQEIGYLFTDERDADAVSDMLGADYSCARVIITEDPSSVAPEA